MADTVERIGRVRPTLVEDGRWWWSLRAICDALRCSNYQAASALIPPEHKRRWKDSPRDWKRRKAWCVIDRKGVERLVIRYCHDAPRWAVMAALDAGAVIGNDQTGESRALLRSAMAERCVKSHCNGIVRQGTAPQRHCIALIGEGKARC